MSKKILKRYAHVLLSHAIKSGHLKEMADEVMVLSNQFKNHPNLHLILNNPTLRRSAKYALLEKLVSHPILRKFISLLTEQYCLGSLKEVLHAFIKAYYAYIGTQSAILTTAIPLPNAMVNLLIQEVKQWVSCKEVLLEQRTDPTIMGGYVLQVGNLKLDRSIKHYLSLLKNHFT